MKTSKFAKSWLATAEQDAEASGQGEIDLMRNDKHGYAVAGDRQRTVDGHALLLSAGQGIDGPRNRVVHLPFHPIADAVGKFGIGVNQVQL